MQVAVLILTAPTVVTVMKVTRRQPDLVKILMNVLETVIIANHLLINARIKLADMTVFAKRATWS